MGNASNMDPGGKLARLHGDLQQQMMDEDLKDAVSPFPALSLVVRKLGTSVAQTLVEGGFKGAAGRHSHRPCGRTKARLILVPVVDAVDTEPHV